MMYYVFYNPFSRTLECESSKDYHEIKYALLSQAGQKDEPGSFCVVNHRSCVSKKQVKNLEKWMKDNLSKFVASSGVLMKRKL